MKTTNLRRSWVVKLGIVAVALAAGVRLALAAGALAEPAAAIASGTPSPHTFYLVRHGNYDSSVQPADGLGSGLTAIGVAQARLAGARLAALPHRWDALLASPLRRAQETARVVGSDLGATLETVAELAECTPKTRRAEVTAKEKPADMAACAAKLDGLFAARFQPSPAGERREIVVCHGNVIRYLVTKALGVDSEAWLEMSVGHASLTVIRVEADGRFKVISIGDVGYLPFNLLTGATGDPPRDLAVP
jgi:serine/threonine-protein phosphatase PGAM5